MAQARQNLIYSMGNANMQICHFANQKIPFVLPKHANSGRFQMSSNVFEWVDWIKSVNLIALRQEKRKNGRVTILCKFEDLVVFVRYTKI